MTHGHDLTWTGEPAGYPSLSAGTNIQPSDRANDESGRYLLASGSACAELRRTGTTSANPTVDVTLRASGKASAISPSLLLAAASRSRIRRPTTSQTASAASSRPGKRRTGVAPTKPIAVVSPGVS